MTPTTFLLHGDCLEMLPTLADSSVDSIVTDPPYGLSFMGKKWDYDVPDESIWRECLRVLKPGGHLLAFAGTRTQHRMAVRIEDAGFEIRDMIAWVYGSGFPKSHNLKDEWQGWGTALKPALEPITVARKPFIGTVAENVLTHGTGAMNIDSCRVAIDVSVDDPRLGGKGTWSSDKMAKNVYEGGYAGKRVGSSPDGRWPANLIHDGSDEVVGLFPETTSGAIKAGQPAGRDMRAGSEDHNRAGGRPVQPRDVAGSTGSASRFFYCAKASKRDRDEGLEGFDAKAGDTWGEGIGHASGAAVTRRNAHPTVKPTDLMRYLCRLITPVGGTVLDPFMGSGSTGKAAMKERFNFIGIERDESYFEIAKARIENAKLFLSEMLI